MPFTGVRAEKRHPDGATSCIGPFHVGQSHKKRKKSAFYAMFRVKLSDMFCHESIYPTKNGGPQFDVWSPIASRVLSCKTEWQP